MAKKPTNKKPLTKRQQETKKAEAAFKSFVTRETKKNPNIGANELLRKYRSKPRKYGIGNDKGKAIIREKTARPYQEKKATKTKFKNVTSKSKQKFLSPYTYRVGYKMEGDSTEHYIMLSRNERLPDQEVIEQAKSLLRDIDRKGKNRYQYTRILMGNTEDDYDPDTGELREDVEERPDTVRVKEVWKNKGDVLDKRGRIRPIIYD